MADLSVLKNIVRTGRVSSVNAGNRTARVTFEDKGQSPLVSGELKVIKNPPFIPAKGAAQRTESESGGSGEAAFAAHSHAVKILQAEFYHDRIKGRKVARKSKPRRDQREIPKHD